MKPGKAILIYATALLVVSTVLAPWIFFVVHSFGDWPFRRVFDRVILVVALVGLWPLLRVAGIRSWSALGYVPEMFRLREVALGLALGVGSYGAGGLWLASSLRADSSFSGYLWLDTGSQDVKLTVVPEPSAGMLVGSGLLAMLLVRRWRR
jgi:hypothetical protein